MKFEDDIEIEEPDWDEITKGLPTLEDIEIGEPDWDSIITDLPKLPDSIDL